MLFLLACLLNVYHIAVSVILYNTSSKNRHREDMCVSCVGVVWVGVGGCVCVHVCVHMYVCECTCVCVCVCASVRVTADVVIETVKEYYYMEVY